MELRTDIDYEYDDTFKVVRIFQVIERSELMTDYKPVDYEHATLCWFQNDVSSYSSSWISAGRPLGRRFLLQLERGGA